MNSQAIKDKSSRTSFTVFGVIAIILGMLSMMAPGLTGFSVVLLLGFTVLAAGIVRIIWALKAGSFRKGLAGFVVGGLTLLCGIMLIGNPLFSSAVLTIMLVIYFICDGIFEIIAAFQLKPLEGWGWLTFSGIISILLGILIWRQYPLAGVWAMGIFIGIKLFMIGLIMITGGAITGEPETNSAG